MNRALQAPRLPRQALAVLVALAAGAPMVPMAQTPAPGARPTAPVPAPAPAMAAPAASPVFAIQGFRIEGDNPIGDIEAQRVLAPYVRADATLESLQQATAALEAALTAQGYGLHKVALPPQEVGRIVRLSIVKFTIGQVAIEGRQVYDEGNIRRTLPELQEGESPNFKTLAIQTAIANENPNKQVQVALRESDQPDRIDATITVREQRPWTFGVGISNGGSKNTGEDRLTVTAGHTNLWNRDHQFVAAYTTSIDEPEDVRQFGLAYRIPLYAQGGVVGASYTRSDVVGNFGDFTSTGAGHTFGLNYTLYLPPEGGRRRYVTFGFEDKVFKAGSINVSGIVSQVGEDRRSAPFIVGYTVRTESDTAVWAYNVDLAINTTAGSHNNLTAYQSEDPRIDTAAWKAVRGGASRAAAFGTSGWLWSARTLFQWSPDTLISGEQFGLGGLGSVRGTDIDRPLSGDSGISGTLEASTPELFPGLRAFGFADAGYIYNNRPLNDPLATTGQGRLRNDHLASVGVGLRYAKAGLAASAEYGRIVLGSRLDEVPNGNVPKNGDGRFYLNLSYQF